MTETTARRRLKRAVTVGLAIVFLLGVGCVVVAAVPQVVGAEHSYVVTSGSMSPEINAGDVVIVREVSTASIERGDVITFKRSAESTERVTHRVVEVLDREESRAFKTKGDANEEPDLSPVTETQVIGQVWFHLPYLGYLVVFASSREGLLALVIVPAVLLVVSESYVLAGSAISGPPQVQDSGDGTGGSELPIEDPEAASSEHSDAGGGD